MPGSLLSFCLPIENAPTQCYNKPYIYPMILPRKEFKYMAKNQPMTPPAGDEIFLLKMGEMVLKGLNRRTFEERLMGNARRRLEKFGKFRIYSASPSPISSRRPRTATWTGPSRP